jgi:excisionase family DNA binding protein
MSPKAHAAAADFEAMRLSDWKLSYRVDEACAATGYGRTKLWDLIRAGKLKAKKDAGVTIIRRTDLQAYIDNLPDALRADWVTVASG